MKLFFAVVILLIPFQTAYADPAVDTLMASMQNMMYQAESYASQLKSSMLKASVLWNKLQLLEQEAVRNPAVKSCSTFKVLQASYKAALRELPPLHRGLQQSLWHVSNYQAMIAKAAVAAGGRSGLIAKIALKYRVMAHAARMARFAPFVGGLTLSMDLARSIYEFGDQGLLGQTCGAAELVRLSDSLCEDIVSEYFLTSAEFLIRFGTTGTGLGSDEMQCKLNKLEQEVAHCRDRSMGPFNDSPEYIYYTGEEEADAMEPTLCPIEEEMTYSEDDNLNDGYTEENYYNDY